MNLFCVANLLLLIVLCPALSALAQNCETLQRTTGGSCEFSHKVAVKQPIKDDCDPTITAGDDMVWKNIVAGNGVPLSTDESVNPTKYTTFTGGIVDHPVCKSCMMEIKDVSQDGTPNAPQFVISSGQNITGFKGTRSMTIGGRFTGGAQASSGAYTARISVTLSCGS